MRVIRKIVGIVSFIIFYVWELILSNFRVLYDVLTPRHNMQPGIIAMPLDAKTDLEILAVANLLSMTPGSISMDVSADKKYLYIHVMYIDNIDELRRILKTRFEARVLEVLR